VNDVPFIAKSRFLWGLQYPKPLWTAYNAKDQIPEPDAARQAVADAVVL
jgi:hypothetical protein